MAVEAVVSVVIEKLTVLIEKSLIVDKVIDQVEEIRIAVRRMMRDAEGEKQECNKEEEEEERKKWTCEYLGILYQVEDVIETFALARHQRRTSLWPIGGFFNHLRSHQRLRQKMLQIGIQIKQLNNDQKPIRQAAASFNRVSSPAQPLQHTAQHMEYPEEEKEVNGSIDWRRLGSSRLHAISQVGNEVRPALALARELRRTTSALSFNECLRQPKLTFNFSFEEEGESSIVGFQKDVGSLVNQLTNEKDDHPVISIVGAVGSGKTTLAHAIYKSKRIKDFKYCRVWVSISKGYTHKDILLSILKQMGSLEDKDELPTSDQLLEIMLLEALKKTSYLIVLDDVRAGDVWENLKHAFAKLLSVCPGSKIIITTCNQDLALPAHPPCIRHEVGQLNDSDSWKMFLKKARLSETSIDKKSLLGQKILEKCDGLPLTIVLLGGLLSTKKEASCDEWYRLLFDHSNMDILSLSYNDLQVHSKLCVLYLALFPKEVDIPVRRLLRLWLAEGFVKRSPTMIPEDVVQEYFEDLVKRNMIQISKLRSDGSFRGCRLLGALHDDFFSKAQDISLFHIHRNSDTCGAADHPLSVRRIVEYVDIKNCKPSQFQNLRSYLSFNFQKKDTPAREVGQFVSKIIGKKGFGLLRVLDLEGVYKPSLPDNLGDLFHLRYLGLRWTFIDYLPSSVGTLTYLETLDLKHTYISGLPNSIWKLKHLRHLNLNEIRLDMPPQPPSSQLLTLWGLFIDHKSPVENGLNRLRDLRELGITFHLTTSSGQKYIADWVANLTALQSLRLRSRDERGCPLELCLNPLSGLKKLSHLYLLGNLQKLPDKCDFPPAVKVLTLSVSQLKEDPMPILGRLPSLTVLRLLADSYVGKKITCPLRGFSKLQVLKLWMLKELEEWELKEGAMQNLRELNIRCCDKLNNIPQRLMQSSTLEELILTNMPKKFVADVQQKFKNPPTVKNWKFSPLPWEQEPET